MLGGGAPALDLPRDTSGWRRRSWLLGGGQQRRGPLLRRASSDPLETGLDGEGRGDDGQWNKPGVQGSSLAGAVCRAEPERAPDGCISQEETDARGDALIGRARDRGEAQGQERTQTAKTQGHQYEKKARTVAVSSESSNTDNDGESDDNSDTDSKQATRTPPTNKQKRA